MTTWWPWALGVAATVPVVAVHVYGRLPRATPRAQAIVVAGAKVHPDGRPSSALLARVAAAVALWKDERAPFLCFTGAALGGAPSEASVAARLAAEAGVPREAMLLDERSTSTATNATEAWALLEPLGARQVVLVTDDFHLWRATRLFRARGFTVAPHGVHRALSPLKRLGWTAREAAASLRLR